MNQNQLTIKVLELIWSALHSPNNHTHPGLKALDLLKNTLVDSYAKSLLDDLETNKKFNSSILTELENRLIENEDLNTPFLAIVKSASSQAFKELPYDGPLDAPNDYGSISNWAIISGIFIVLRIIYRLLKY